MSCYLWKFFFEDDVESFRRLLAEASYVNAPAEKRGSVPTPGTGYLASSVSSPGTVHKLSASGTTPTKTRKSSGRITVGPGSNESRWSNLTLTRADVNLKDRNGLNLLLHAVSSTAPSAIGFATALLAHPLLDLYAQDVENGWTVLHRALYFGNITIARLVMERDMRDILCQNKFGSTLGTAGLIRFKDREGNSPFDVLNATVASRVLAHRSDRGVFENENNDADEEADEFVSDGSDADDEYGQRIRIRGVSPSVNIDGDEVFMFGSNKNLTLGFGDGDDRHFPERITLTRPDHLLHRFYYEHLHARMKGAGQTSGESDRSTSPVPHPKTSAELPALIHNRPLVIQDVVLSKLHTAVLTADPESNLYTCGFGPGGRLGTGDETTRFSFVCIEGGGLDGKRVVAVALGQNHTLAITSEGELFTWGSNSRGQLGYTLPKPSIKDDEPVQALPRQVFGPLKRERVMGAAASRIHSVIFTSTSLYTFGKNEGQLGLVDADARSLDVQTTPRRVAASLFSSPVRTVSAIDRATTCLLENYDVWVFANYGYAKMSFPLEGFSNSFLKSSLLSTRYDATPNHIAKITSGGDTICAMSQTGDVFTVHVGQRIEPGLAAASTTNPTKIRNALPPPQRIWSLRKGHMAVRDVEMGQDGSIIICTESGSVWRRTKRPNRGRESDSVVSGDYRAKDYKFSRVPGLTRIKAVRGNTFGSYAAIRRDCDVTKTQILDGRRSLWDDIGLLSPFSEFQYDAPVDEPDTDANPRFWTPALPKEHVGPLKRAVLMSDRVEEDLSHLFHRAALAEDNSTDVEVCTTTASTTIPAHRFMLGGRSTSLRKLLDQCCREGQSSIPDLLTIHRLGERRLSIRFHGLDFVTILNFVQYIYQDTLVDVWHHARQFPQSAQRFRQVRTELMRLASRLELRELESAVRLMGEPGPRMDQDLAIAMSDPTFFQDTDVIVELAGSEVAVHGALVCRRCPFFEGLFAGRAAGRWLSSRREHDEVSLPAPVRIDLRHVEPAIFHHVLRYLYTDVGEELFDEVVTSDLDAFLDIVIETLSVANELMLDRLSGICQQMLGRFVTIRNACQLLNAIGPCSVTEFKDACLEYLCLNLEGLLENHLLDELDEDLLLELDAKVRENQLAYLPFVRSGRAEMLLDAKYPDLMASKTRERQTKIDSVNLRAKIGALLIDSEGEPISTSSRARRKSSKPSDPGVETILALGLNSKASTADLMFTMDEEDVAGRNVASAGPETPARSPRPSPGGITSSPRMTPREDVWYGSNGKIIPSPLLGPVATSPSAVRQESKPRLMGKTATSQSSGGDSSAQAWGSSPALSSSKLDLKQILAQTSVGRRSNLSAQMPLRVKEQNGSALPIVGVKLSQKERKKQQLQLQQQQQQHELQLQLQQEQEQEQQQARQSVHLINSLASKPVAVMEESPKPTSPWQSQSVGPRVSLQEVLSGATRPVSESLTQTSSIPIISLESGPSTRSKYNGSPSGLPHSPRVSSHSKTNFPGLPGSSPTPSARIPQAEPTLQLSMAEIIVQQRTEQEILRQAVAKRSLQEIQQEQEFMQWWDSEARKTALAAAELKMDASRGSTRDGESDRGTRGARGGSRGRGRGRGRGEGGSRGGSSSAQKPVRDETKTGSPDSKRMISKGRGRGGSSRGKQTSRSGPS